MQEPFWLPVWQAAYAILSIATECALVLPFMVFLCLFLGRKRHRVAMSQTASIMHVLGLATAVLGAIAVAGAGCITLIVLPSCMPDLVPAPFEPFSTQWLATTTGFLSWTGGLLLFCLSWMLARPAYRTSAQGDKAGGIALGNRDDGGFAKQAAKMHLVADTLAGDRNKAHGRGLVVDHANGHFIGNKA